ncbi:hypothetical protein HYW58_00580 [Candidatus Kaiserbacteria bacterium]|nr:hypothetical protein [Candidatus Kaiserbacteria bacterium]
MKHYIRYVGTLIAFFFLVSAPVALAQIRSGCGTGTGLQNPLRNICSFEAFVELLLQAVIRIGLPIAVLFIVYSGLLFVTAQGNDEKLTKAKDVFFYTVLGTAIFLGSWVLAKIIETTIRIIAG